MERNDMTPANSGGEPPVETVVIIPEEAVAVEVNAAIYEESSAREALALQLNEVQTEIAIIRARLQAIRHQAEVVTRTNIGWVDACAHDQLGSHPWLKLSGAAAVAFMTGKLLRRVPLGLMVIAARPLLSAAMRDGLR